jgi:hypothetical protein
MPRKRPTGRTKAGAQRGIARVASDFLASWSAQAGGLSEAQRALMSRMTLELLAEARPDEGPIRVKRRE